MAAISARAASLIGSVGRSVSSDRTAAGHAGGSAVANGGYKRVDKIGKRAVCIKQAANKTALSFQQFCHAAGLQSADIAACSFLTDDIIKVFTV